MLEKNKMPLLFVGHGSPMNAIEENSFTKKFTEISDLIPRPSAILCISAHWYINKTMVTAMEKPKTIHDFGGFPKTLYDIIYPANGSPELAKEIKKLINNVSVELDYNWGLDHGTWTVLKHIYPNADIPVIQLSIDFTKNLNYHYELAKKLSILRENGILIIGSGNIVHNLSLIDFQNIDKENYGYEWALEARNTINNLLSERDFNALINYKALGKSVELAIPTPEHYIPMIYILGLINLDESITLFNDKLIAGSLSMTSFIAANNI